MLIIAWIIINFGIFLKGRLRLIDLIISFVPLILRLISVMCSVALNKFDLVRQASFE